MPDDVNVRLSSPVLLIKNGDYDMAESHRSYLVTLSSPGILIMNRNDDTMNPHGSHFMVVRKMYAN